MTTTPIPPGVIPETYTSAAPRPATHAPASPARAVHAPVVAAKSPEAHHAGSAAASTALSSQALSRTDVSYVDSLMGALPAQKMEEILLRTGVPIPANLGPNIDTTA